MTKNDQAHVDSVPELAQQATGGMNEPDRCAVCGWPLKSRAIDGCVVGSCSMRPLPRPREATRAIAEYGAWAPASWREVEREQLVAEETRERREMVKASVAVLLDDARRADAESGHDQRENWRFSHIDLIARWFGVAGLPAAREAQASGSVSTVSDGESKEP
jgi:hypothetical protein